MPQVGLESLRAGSPNHPRKRVGRGPGSGHGKTSGKGHKGQKARSGGVKGAAFEGGQTPLQRRLPKRGFSNAPFAREWRILNVERLNRLPAGSRQDAETLVSAGILPDGPEPLKILGGGVLEVGLTVVAHAFSASAREKIVAAGGRAEIVGQAPEA
jgi:large subunit ribosomal protein L15